MFRKVSIKRYSTQLGGIMFQLFLYLIELIGLHITSMNLQYYHIINFLFKCLFLLNLVCLEYVCIIKQIHFCYPLQHMSKSIYKWLMLYLTHQLPHYHDQIVLITLYKLQRFHLRSQVTLTYLIVVSLSTKFRLLGHNRRPAKSFLHENRNMLIYFLLFLMIIRNYWQKCQDCQIILHQFVHLRLEY